MKAPDVVGVDFETEAIEARPHYPPVPVGVALQEPGESRPRYLRWGHPSGNNCSFQDARRALAHVWRDPRPKVFHHGKFDLDVAQVHCGLPLLPTDKYHDTMFSLFLLDPYAPSLGLKSSARKHLGRLPKGQEHARQWIMQHVPEARRKPSSWGAYICKLPGELAAVYAGDDISFTLGLHRKLYPEVLRLGMGAAYDRERRLVPHLLAAERRGLRINVPLLRRESTLYERVLVKVDAWVRQQLRAPELNLDSNDELVAALLKAKVAKASDFLMTPGGEISASKASLREALDNRGGSKLLQAIGYRNRLTTCLTMFMRPWLVLAQETGGTVHPSWHQVRQGKGEGSGNMGARSGRLITSDPNFLNLSKDFEGKEDGYAHPTWWRGLPRLPLVRRYVLPAKGARWGHRDYNQQELRICAHFEDGALMRRYQEDPRLDVHEFVRREIHRVYGVLMERRPVKILNFGMLYGLGFAGLARKLGSTYEQAQEIKGAQQQALPGVRELEQGIKALGRAGEPIRTWGGRLYWTEEPRIKDGDVQRFEYKLLNYLIQGSAADATKEAVLRYHEVAKEGHFDVTVYDEINCSMFDVPSEMRRLKQAMESVEFDVKLVSDAKVGRSWGELKAYRD